MAFLTDISANNLSLSINGSVTNETNIVKYGTGSAYFNGSSSLQTNALTLGTSDFTCECWVYPSISNVNITIFNQGNTDTTGCFLIYIDSNNRLAFYTDNGLRFSGSNIISANTWTHVAVSRLSNTYYSFVDGQLNSTYTGVHNHNQLPFKIGDGYGGIRWYNGFIDDLRVTKGVARYTTTFTPPTAQLLDPTETISLGNILQENSDRLLLEIN